MQPAEQHQAAAALSSEEASGKQELAALGPGDRCLCSASILERKQNGVRVRAPMQSTIPFELVEEEEMRAIEAALQQASRRLVDIEDMALPRRAWSLTNFPPKRSLCVTDVTSLEWCERQFELKLTRGKPKKTPAMRAGNARHTELEAEVVTRVELDVQTREDSWAVRLINFMLGAQQLLTEGLTREIPVVALVEGVWLTGIIDELKFHDGMGVQLLDTKTRVRQCLPSEAQKRNARLQLMCYKLLWDTMCQQGLPQQFLEHFELQPRLQLSDSLISHVDAAFGCKVKCLEELVEALRTRCSYLPILHPSLTLRYEWQADRSLLGEEAFDFDLEWLRLRLVEHLDFWHGRRQAHLASDDWKCQFCPFVQECRAKPEQEIVL